MSEHGCHQLSPARERLRDVGNCAVVMDVIKTEPDPLATQINDNTDLYEKKPSPEDLDLLYLHSTEVKTECEDACDVTSEIKFEEPPVPNTFAIVKCEAKEDLDIVEDDLKLEVSAEENEIQTDSFADTHDSTVPSECVGFGHEEFTIIYGDAKHSVSSAIIFRTHTDEKRFKCDVCGKNFSNSSYMRRHVLKHTGEKPFKCHICGKCFFEHRHLKSHTRVHTGDKPFKCYVCGKSFSQQSNLKCHERLHTGERPFKCDVCGKCFSQGSNLKSHERLHTGERPFKCEVCGKCFSHSATLMSHERLHSGEKPYKCDVCGKRFSQHSNLKSHELMHADKAS